MGFRTLEPLSTRKLAFFLSSPAITLPTQRRFPNGLFLCSLCDMGRDRVQRVQITLAGEVSWHGSKIAYSYYIIVDPGTCSNPEVVALGPFRLNLRRGPSPWCLCPWNASAGARALSEGGVGRTLKLPSRVFFLWAI